MLGYTNPNGTQGANSDNGTPDYQSQYPYALNPDDNWRAYSDTYGQQVPRATIPNPYATPDAPPPPAPVPHEQPKEARRKEKNTPGWLALISVAVITALLTSLLTLVLSGAFLDRQTATTSGSASNPTATLPASTAAASQTTPVASSGSRPVLTVSQVSEQVRPAVVQITATVNRNGTGGIFGNGGGSGEGVGSGVIYDKAGYILTNSHVIDGATTLVVTLPDGKTFDAKLIGQDRLTDLAVIKIEPNGQTLPVAKLGDSSQLKVGDGVVAIGNALALPGGPTVTSGVVGALDRNVTEPASSSNTSGIQLYGMVQTDAAINPGNSGGALVNMNGEVVGINTLVAGQADNGLQAQGIGFAIPINAAKKIADELVANGKVSHGYMGISYQFLTPAQARQLGITGVTGGIVQQVQANSPAAQAGLKRGDVVTAIDGQKITGESTLGRIISEKKAGDQVQLEVISPTAAGGNGQTRTITVTLGERPANP
jgi:serine protease Do